ncbi:CvpA family protein [Bombilactobacillus bombi]|uniref:CvpA family protein n=1 Tax=Bombilactobacillus bombi TaxID=1303590 RepID=UPI0015E621F1|nr:CvpA family protein [Bombilactobacillus bombi]MBA1434516.1 CvpA family protein [Bombilactobacillus bombi]
MVSGLIILILAYGVYVGVRRGLVMQMVYTTGYAISLAIAIMNCRWLGSKLDLLVPYPSASPRSYFAFFSTKVSLSLDQAFYCGVAFVFILFVGWMITRIIGAYLHDLTFYPLPADLNHVSGALLAFICNYAAIFFVLYVLALIPISGLQKSLNNSLIASTMIRYSIFLTRPFTQLLLAIP